MSTRTRIELGRREDLGGDCANCFGLCCTALAFSRSVDFPVDKAAGDPCVNLDDENSCRIHPQLRASGYKGCTVFDCFGAGQKVSRHTFEGRSWRDDTATRDGMFAVFPLMRRLHELLWYLDVAAALPVESELRDRVGREFDRVNALTLGQPDDLLTLDIDSQFEHARPLLLEASAVVRATRVSGTVPRWARPGTDRVGVDLRGCDLRGADLRGGLLIAADLRGADLRWCDVLGLDLRDANLSDADLSAAIYLTQVQVNGATGNAGTKLPAGFDRPRHWLGAAPRGPRGPAA
ncbi:MAG TPA: pentapeptide repeat-containing protein [Galbitalea sp.]|jgi:uncharacterized protein YjbI with pentapeptide repeats|nr:pentapeptide repeat-containing protein [Galbitalea sp.]